MAIFGLGKHHHDGEHEKDHLRNILIVGFSIFFLGMLAYSIGTGQLTFEGSFKAQDIWALFSYAMVGFIGYAMGKTTTAHDNHTSTQNTPDQGAGGAK